MALITLKHGAIFDIANREEIEELLKQYQTRQDTRERVRAGATLVLDANGIAQEEVYSVPIGFEFEARRVFMDLSSVTESTLPVGTINLSGAGLSVQYMRSGTRIEWANPASPVGSGGRVPGTQTWGSQQGPYLRNGEVLEVRAVLGAGHAGDTLIVMLEGILTQAGSLK